MYEFICFRQEFMYLMRIKSVQKCIRKSANSFKNMNIQNIKNKNKEIS